MPFLRNNLERWGKLGDRLARARLYGDVRLTGCVEGRGISATHGLIAILASAELIVSAYRQFEQG
jgi:hypothetical protein